MAALYESVRNYRKHPITTKQDNQIPIVQRRSLNPAKRNALRTGAVSKASHQDKEEQSTINYATTHQIHNTDDLEESTQPPVLRCSVQTGKQRSTHRRFPWGLISLFLSVVLGLAVILYTIIFVVVWAWSTVTNTFTYGLTHTSYNHTKINDQEATIISGNDNGHITITIIQRQQDGTTLTRSYQGPELEASAWNNDLASIVATSSVANDGKSIHITLTGNINYFRPFFIRPSMTFSLVPDNKQGYMLTL